jgi:ParB family chromosome partitioning protein
MTAMATKRPTLSRGLGALLGQPAVATPAAAAVVTALRPVDEELRKLPVDLLQRGKYQPRIDLRQETLQELADSIKAQGVVQPIVVRPINAEGVYSNGQTEGPAEQRYEIIAGERRWRAAQLAGLHEIPAVIRRVPDEAAIAMALIENIQRENLNPLEEARALQRLITEFEMTHATAAEAVGRSRAAVSNLLRLLDLGEDASKLVENRELDMGHARALLAIESKRQQAEVAAQVAQQKLSVRETEALVKRLASQPSGSAQEAAPRVDPNIRKLEADLSEKLGAKVQFQHASSGKGKLVISYHSLEELDGILEHIR